MSLNQPHARQGNALVGILIALCIVELLGIVLGALTYYRENEALTNELKLIGAELTHTTAELVKEKMVVKILEAKIATLSGDAAQD
jgi:hypothetical protein